MATYMFEMNVFLSLPILCVCVLGVGEGEHDNMGRMYVPKRTSIPMLDIGPVV